jgi:hypothetical protein
MITIVVITDTTLPITDIIDEKVVLSICVIHPWISRFSADINGRY